MTNKKRLESVNYLAEVTQLQGEYPKQYYMPDKDMEYCTGYEATIHLADKPGQRHRRFFVVDLETGEVTNCQLSLTDWYADDSPSKADIQRIDRRIRYLLSLVKKGEKKR